MRRMRASDLPGCASCFAFDPKLWICRITGEVVVPGYVCPRTPEGMIRRLEKMILEQKAAISQILMTLDEIRSELRTARAPSMAVEHPAVLEPMEEPAILHRSPAETLPEVEELSPEEVAERMGIDPESAPGWMKELGILDNPWAGVLMAKGRAED